MKRASSKPQERQASVASQARVAERAYELYLLRGPRPGGELEDWLDAEAELASRAAVPVPREHEIERPSASGPRRGRAKRSAPGRP